MSETVEAKVVRKQGKALLVELDNGNQVWIPHSLLEEGGSLLEGERGEITVPSWFAEREGME